MRENRIPDDFAQLFRELSEPVDPTKVRAGFKELSQWIGSPRRRLQTGVTH